MENNITVGEPVKTFDQFEPKMCEFTKKIQNTPWRSSSTIKRKASTFLKKFETKLKLRKKVSLDNDVNKQERNKTKLSWTEQLINWQGK